LYVSNGERDHKEDNEKDALGLTFKDILKSQDLLIVVIIPPIPLVMVENS